MTPSRISVDRDALRRAIERHVAQEPLYAIGEARIRGQSYRVFKHAPASLATMFAFGANHGDKDFLIYEDDRITFADLWRRGRRFAHVLRDRLGVKKGERVAIAMRNYPEWCVAYVGVVALGAVVTPLNAWWNGEELRYALADSGARVVIVDAKRLELIAPFKDALGLTLILARGGAAGADHAFEALMADAPDSGPPEVSIDADDDFSLVYTSGSTGTPKGALLTHRSAVSALLSWSLLASSAKEANGGASILGDNPGALLAVPLFHVTGSHSLFMFSWLIGRRLVMMYRWNVGDAVSLIKRHQLTNFFGVPSQTFELGEAVEAADVPSLIDIGAGGAKRPAEHVVRLIERIPHANPSAGYGLTETNALGCLCTLDDYRERPDSAGRPVPPVTDIKIMTESGEAPTGVVGEVWIRSPANFRGYHNLPEETGKALDADGWFRTGDLGRFDADGFLTIVDRLKDLIIRGGENISCLEVEARAYAFLGVFEAAAFSVPDPVLGERVGLVVHPRENALDLSALRAFMAQGLAPYKVPERIWIAPQPLPRLGTEKFDKRMIKAVALRHPPHWST